MSCYSSEILMQEVARYMDQINDVSLGSAKKLMDLVELESKRKGLKMVMAVCNPAGNMIAVHAMDDAFLISFDLAMRKAYTAVALKTSTLELGKQVGVGQSSYGMDKLGDGKIVVVAGGVPLINQGRIIGGLGISGGTGMQDHEMAEYGARLMADPNFFTT